MPRRALDVLRGAVEDSHLRLAEAVDALLGVADDEQPPAGGRVRQGVNDALLGHVRVLELVHHDVVQPLQVACQAGIPRLGVQQALGHQLQVVEVEGLAVGFHPVVHRHRPLPQSPPALQGSSRLLVQLAHFEGTAGLVQCLRRFTQGLERRFELRQGLFSTPGIGPST